MERGQEKHQVDWNKSLYDKFVERAMLSEDEQFILRTRIQGMYVSQQARELGMSESNIHKKISAMKLKYDKVQKLYDDMPVRRYSKQEKIMDTN